MFPDIMNAYGPKLVLAVVVVAAALFLLFLVARFFGNRSRSNPRRSAVARARVAVVDTTQVDATRQLVLVRRDDVEHLILVGGPSDVVVESGIGASGNGPRVVAAPERPVQTPRPASPVVLRATVPAATTASPEPVQGPADPEVRIRPASVERTAVNRAGEASRSGPAPVDRHAPPLEPSHPTLDEVAARRDVENVLDDARGRVFGGAPEPDVAPAASRIEPPPAPQTDRGEPGPAARFEDVLDAEIAGDLSAVTPGGIRHPTPADRHPPSPMAPKKVTPAVDTEMERLLGELSPKR